MFPTATETMSKKDNGVKFGQDGLIGYHAFGSPAGSELFILTKEKDTLKMVQKFGGAMESVVTNHSLPFLDTPVFAEVMEALAIGEGIGAAAVYDEFQKYLGTPGMAKTALAATRTPITGALSTTPTHAFGSSVTEATDDNLIRAQHLNQYNKLVADVQAHNRGVVKASEMACAEFKARMSFELRSKMKLCVNTKDARHDPTATPPIFHYMWNTKHAGHLYGELEKLCTTSSKTIQEDVEDDSLKQIMLPSQEDIPIDTYIEASQAAYATNQDLHGGTSVLDEQCAIGDCL
jgi:hypothetical protein